MPRHAALLRGVMPTNCKMPDLRRAFEAAGFTDVATVLGSGNVVFTARAAGEAALARKAETAMRAELGRVFPATVRAIAELEELIATDPWQRLRIPPGAKRVVTFLPEPPAKKLALPIERDGARILAITGRTVLTAYERTPRGPVFMALIAETFGDRVTTRTWDTIGKIVQAAA